MAPSPRWNERHIKIPQNTENKNSVAKSDGFVSRLFGSFIDEVACCAITFLQISCMGSVPD
jgi:hypothetical protein